MATFCDQDIFSSRVRANKKNPDATPNSGHPSYGVRGIKATDVTLKSSNGPPPKLFATMFGWQICLKVVLFQAPHMLVFC
jgi:hypothetical protein